MPTHELPIGSQRSQHRVHCHRARVAIGSAVTIGQEPPDASYGAWRVVSKLYPGTQLVSIGFAEPARVASSVEASAQTGPTWSRWCERYPLDTRAGSDDLATCGHGGEPVFRRRSFYHHQHVWVASILSSRLAQGRRVRGTHSRWSPAQKRVS